MHLFVTLTHECNLKCSYCYGKCCDDFDSGDNNGEGDGFGEIDYDLPDNISYDVSNLGAFAEKEPVENLIFYGGEPLLRLNTIYEMMDKVPAKRFMVQTNGLLLHQLEPSYLRRLHTLLVSIDGDEMVTDGYRGYGVYQQVLEQIRLVRQRGFAGEIVARMTVGRQTDIDKQVLHLLFETDGLFDSAHWQLDAQFWRSDYDPNGFSSWVRESYRPRLLNLIDKWVKYMEREHDVLRIYPFLGVTETLLSGAPAGLRCGSGWAQLNVQTDGSLAACPAMSGMKRYYFGHIRSGVQHGSAALGSPCTSCQTLQLCGGRCLYANVTKLWSETGFGLVCGTVKTLISGLEAALPQIRRLIKNGDLSLSDFEFTKFNSCEIIP